MFIIDNFDTLYCSCCSQISTDNSSITSKKAHRVIGRGFDFPRDVYPPIVVVVVRVVIFLGWEGKGYFCVFWGGLDFFVGHAFVFLGDISF